jgi:TonB-linked SusC/RagA family outer membrane protein
MKQKQPLSVLMLFLVLHFFVGNGYAQQMDSVPIFTSNTTVEQVLNKIEETSDYVFLYNDKTIQKDRLVSVKNKSGKIPDILDEIFLGTDVTYTIADKQIILSMKKSDWNRQGSPIQLTGVVKDVRGEPLIGVGIKLKNRLAGTVTDLDGRFAIQAGKGDILDISYVGYVTKTVEIVDDRLLNIVLEEDIKVLGEIVVTALGIKRAQKALSYNVQTVGQEELTKAKDVNFINALSGKIAGVTINASSSGAGGASKVVMRGVKSIERSSNALYVIDGIPMYNQAGSGSTEFGSSGVTEAIADINPEDIESISVLTGAAAAALYGNEGANGAIVITTKKGKAGKASITVSQNTDFLRPFVLPKFQNRYGTGSLLNPGSTVVDKSWGNKLNSANYMDYSPKNDYFKTGVITTETITFSAGTEKNQTYVSIGAVDSRGMIPNNDYNRYNLTFRNTTSFLNDKMTLDIGGNYIKQGDLNMTNQGVYQNPLIGAYLFPRGDDWNDIKMYERYDTGRKIFTQYWPQGIDEYVGQNPYWINYRNLRNNRKDRYMFNANLNYNILDWFNVSGRFKIDNSDTEYTEKLYATSNTTLTEGSTNGFFEVKNTKDKQLYADLLGNINKALTENITLQANIGVSVSDMQQSLAQVRGPLIDTEETSAIPNKFALVQLDRSKTKHLNDGYHDQTKSLFASAELGYKGVYYLTLTGRYDWPSQLAGEYSGVSYFFYPSIGASIILSEIIKMPKQIDYMKLRASFAEVGNPFRRGLANKNYEWSDALQQYITESNYPISDLKPEKTRSWEIGLTTRFGGNFNLDIALYDSKSFNQTFNPKLSVSSGYNTLYVQTGSVRNRGLEFSFGYGNTWRNFKWSSNYTWSVNENKILELVRDWENPLTGEIVNKDQLDVGGLADAHFILKEGGTLGDLYSIYDLQRDSYGSVYVDQDENVTPVRAKEPIKLGSVFPKANMGWRNDFSWKNLNFGFMLSARLGGIVYSATQAIMDRYGVSEASAIARDNGGVIVNGGDVVNAERWYTAIGRSAGIPQYYTYSATNVRLQEVTIGYTFTKSQVWNIADITISLVGRNLWMIYNKAPFDPEAVATTGNYYQGIDYFMMPSSRTLGFNVKLSF